MRYLTLDSFDPPRAIAFSVGFLADLASWVQCPELRTSADGFDRWSATAPRLIRECSRRAHRARSRPTDAAIARDGSLVSSDQFLRSGRNLYAILVDSPLLMDQDRPLGVAPHHRRQNVDFL